MTKFIKNKFQNESFSIIFDSITVDLHIEYALACVKPAFMLN